jgi:hypothetical protein
VKPLVEGELHPLPTKVLRPLHNSYTKNPACPEGDEFVSMLHRFAIKYITRDFVEEYRTILVYLLLDGWSIADDASASDAGGISLVLTGRKPSASRLLVNF